MNSLHNSRSRRGFSLLELLVVISIMGILMALGTVAFTTAQRKSRDARRQGDMKAYQNAFEQYYADEGSYSDGDGCSAMKDPQYLPGGELLDPRPDTDTPYECTSDGDSYCACATLEQADSGNSDDSSTCAPGVGDYYCVTNLQ